MWLTCHICHKVYTLKCNLRRHIKSSHMDKKYKCSVCDKEFKRNEYLKRHVAKKHLTKDIFLNILDCISAETSPCISPNKEESNWDQSPGYDSVDEFLDSILDSKPDEIIQLQMDTVNNIPIKSVLDYPATTVNAPMDYQECHTTDFFLDNLAHYGTNTPPSEPGVSTEEYSPAAPSVVPCIPASTATRHSVSKLINQSSQMDICSLPSMRNPTHKGVNTTPKFTKDKSHQTECFTRDYGTSPQTKQQDPTPMQGWDSPVLSSPSTPDLDIPRYYTSKYQAMRRSLNLPEAVPYQGPTFSVSDEDPLPPHLSCTPSKWGKCPRSSTTKFVLMDYLEDIYTNITPPIGAH